MHPPGSRYAFSAGARHLTRRPNGHSDLLAPSRSSPPRPTRTTAACPSSRPSTSKRSAEPRPMQRPSLPAPRLFILPHRGVRTDTDRESNGLWASGDPRGDTWVLKRAVDWRSVKARSGRSAASRWSRHAVLPSAGTVPPGPSGQAAHRGGCSLACRRKRLLGDALIKLDVGFGLAEEVPVQHRRGSILPRGWSAGGAIGGGGSTRFAVTQGCFGQRSLHARSGLARSITASR